MAATLKKCTGCKNDLDVAQFSKNRKAKDGLNFRCKKCCKDFMAVWRAKNKGKLYAQAMSWRAKNQEKWKAYSTRWYKENRDSEARKRAEWRKNNPSYHSDWKKKNADKVRNYTRIRRMKLAKVEREDYVPSEIYERDGWVCQLCHTDVNPLATGHNPMRASIDHIKPVSKYGNDTRDNVQLAHFACNLRKGATYAAA